MKEQSAATPMTPEEQDDPAPLRRPDHDEDRSPGFRLPSERARQYATTLAALRGLIAASSKHNFPDETGWMLRIAKAAILAARRMEQSSSPEIEEELEALCRVMLTGRLRAPMTPTQRVAAEIMAGMMPFGFNDNATGTTERVLNDEADDIEAGQNEASLEVLTEALSVLRGASNDSQRQAIVLMELHDFLSTFPEKDDRWLAEGVMEILSDIPELGISGNLTDCMDAVTQAMASMRLVASEQQTFMDWHTLNTLLRTLGIKSTGGSSPEELARKPQAQRRGYQHPLARVWQGVKSGKYGHPPFPPRGNGKGLGGRGGAWK